MNSYSAKLALSVCCRSHLLATLVQRQLREITNQGTNLFVFKIGQVEQKLYNFKVEVFFLHKTLL